MLFGVGDDIGGAGPATSTTLQPHIKGSIGANRESTLRVVELQARETQIEGEAVDCVDPVFGEQRLHIGKPTVDQMQPAVIGAL